jgi:hypothetical protein
MSSKIVKYFILFLILILPYDADAQYDDMGVLLGASTYKGELSRHMFNTDFLHPAFGIFYRHNYNRRISLKFELNYGRISGDDAKAETPFEIDRNLSFYSNILEFSPQIEYNFLPFETGRRDYPFTPYLFTGISVFRFNPKAELGSETYDLQPLGTEGQGSNGTDPYNRVQIAIPIGGGIKVSVGNIGIGIEVGARRTYTDYLDDVSTVYPDMNTLNASNGSIAVALSDRSLSRNDSTVTIPDYTGKQRGNSTDNDWYLFAGVTVFWRLSSVMRDICKPFKDRRY